MLFRGFAVQITLGVLIVRKSTVIATCLVNSGMIGDLAAAEVSIANIFAECFPSEIFAKWNSELPESAAQHIISGVGRAMTINVEKFISDLW